VHSAEIFLFMFSRHGYRHMQGAL